jgi:hypothetical protein
MAILADDRRHVVVDSHDPRIQNGDQVFQINHMATSILSHQVRGTMA